MPVKSLWELATSICLKNIRELESIGDYLPYEVVRHILLKVDNAHQLRQIELNSPQIEGETGEIWLKLIERDFPLEMKANSYKPQNPKKWYRVWEKYKREHDDALEESERKLKNALAGLQQDKAKNTSKIIHDKRYLPRERRSQRGWGRDPSMSTLNFTGGSRTKTSNGASVMRRVRRETKEIATIHGVLARSVNRPIHRSQVKAAPQAMIHDHRRAAQPVYRPLAKTPPDVVAEHEGRATYLSDSEEDDGGDGFFDDEEEAPSRPRFKPKSTDQSTNPPSNTPGRPAPPRTVAAPAPPRRLFNNSSKKGSGLLSNSYKPGAQKTQTTGSVPKPVVKASATTTNGSSSHIPPAEEPAKHTQYQPRQRQRSSPPPESAGDSSPPPPQLSSNLAGQKRKSVDIFMRRKKSKPS
ncbi:RNA polymerase II transcription factor SIII subunit A-domain-containing protein [Stachybotrys elegans]|uniref:RNA polymerase II transcription factor SIII subunit A-domain-containing protein n=1 Tax=Stachybotrys elegans TaxID=80388 RepID=A0A8K0SZN1_9HYPO|nr:RNA polymerase II transcription factor SIII subunit A-domain-containing protein [Stachybotrys elegans]